MAQQEEHGDDVWAIAVNMVLFEAGLNGEEMNEEERLRRALQRAEEETARNMPAGSEAVDGNFMRDMGWYERRNVKNHGRSVEVYQHQIPPTFENESLITLQLRRNFCLSAVAYEDADGRISFDMDPKLELKNFAFLWCGRVHGYSAELLRDFTLTKIANMPVVNMQIPESWCGKTIIQTRARELFGITIVGYESESKRKWFPDPTLELPDDRFCKLFLSTTSSNKLHKIVKERLCGKRLAYVKDLSEQAKEGYM